MKQSIHAKNPEDLILEQTLRPRNWKEFIGQEKIKRNLHIILTAARRRSEPCEHLLFYGPAGLGKTTLAHIVAKEMGAGLKTTSGPAIEKAGDLAAILTNLEAGDVLFIDEAHRLNKLIEEVLYPAMEARILHLVIGKGPTARTLDLKLPPFTLIAATTRAGLLSSPFRSRFGATFRLDFYEEKDIEEIIKRSASLLSIPITDEALNILAKASRATPRVANRLLRRARDMAEVEGKNEITAPIASKTLSLLEIDRRGLEATDRKLIEHLIKTFHGGPVGLAALAAATGEEEDTIEELYEPYLMRIGFIERTSRGRMATQLAYEHLGLPYGQSSLEFHGGRGSNPKSEIPAGAEAPTDRRNQKRIRNSND